MSSTQPVRPPAPLPLKLSAALLGLALMPHQAFANERHFSYTYETGVLPPGGKEIELSTTLRRGRENFYSGLDHRMEFEVGVADNLMTSFYLNWHNTTTGDSAGNLTSEFGSDGVSNEWKWKLMDPVADAVGLALYAELTYATTGFEIEPKILLDKKLGNLLLAANVSGELEYETDATTTQLSEISPEVNLGATYELGKRFRAGLEAHNHNAIVKQAGSEEFRWEYASLFLGPVVSYSGDGWWVTLTVLPQWPALRKENGGSILELDDAEKLNARLLFSFHL